MIKTHVEEMLKKRGVTTAYQLQKALGISPSAAAKLFKVDSSESWLSRTSLDRLCKLLDCVPADLITYEPDKVERGKKK